MSRKIVRVEIPSKRPEDLLALGQSLYAKHVADGDASPLDADKMTTLNNQATVADTQNKSAKLHDAQAQTARQVRDTSLGIADGQSAQTDGTVLTIILEARDTLLLKYRGQEEKLGEHGFNVVVGSAKGPTKAKPPG